MQFDGATGYIQVASPAASLAGDLTIELWLNVSLATRQTLVSKGYLSEFELTLETSGHLSFYHGNGTAYESVGSVANAVLPNSWQHVVVTREAASKTIRFYVNGVARGSGAYLLTPAASTRAVLIGRSAGGGQYVNGWLDEVALYAAVLNGAQIGVHHALRVFDGSGTPISLQLAATDAEGDALTFGATGLPPGLTVTAATGLITGTLSAGSAGTYFVTAVVTDGSLSTSQAFTWTVTHVNRAPVLASPGNQSSVEGREHHAAVDGQRSGRRWIDLQRDRLAGVADGERGDGADDRARSRSPAPARMW